MRDFTRYLENLINPAGNYQLNCDNNVGSIHRSQRIYDEIMMIAPTFADNGGLNCDEYNMDWMMIPEYPLPDKWQEANCGLLILFPSTYPDTPPVGFYISQQLHSVYGGTDPHIIRGAAHGAPDLMDSGWYWYCVTLPKGYGGWRPSADYTQPDNLFTFLDMVRESLTNDL